MQITKQLAFGEVGGVLFATRQAAQEHSLESCASEYRRSESARSHQGLAQFLAANKAELSISWPTASRARPRPKLNGLSAAPPLPPPRPQPPLNPPKRMTQQTTIDIPSEVNPQTVAVRERDQAMAPALPPEQIRPPITPAQAKVDAIANLTMSAYAKAGTLQFTREEIDALAADFPDEAFQPGAAGPIAEVAPRTSYHAAADSPSASHHQTALGPRHSTTAKPHLSKRTLSGPQHRA